MSSAFEGLPKTPNLKLNKPGYDNVADIEALNENADILDEEIQGIKNTFVKSVNGINAGDGGNVDLGIMPIAKGGTGQTTASGVRNALGLGNTTGALPIANGGTGANNASDALSNLGAVRSVNGIGADSGGNVTLSTTPIGTVLPFSGNTIPSGYLPCNGSAISRTTYANLFAVIGITYGSGDGSTTFNLPNLTDKFIQGSDTAGTVKSAGLPNITSRITAGKMNGYSLAISSMISNGTQTGALKFSNFTAWAESGWSEKALYAEVLDFNASWSNSIYGKSTTVQPPALTMRYIIKY